MNVDYIIDDDGYRIHIYHPRSPFWDDEFEKICQLLRDEFPTLFIDHGDTHMSFAYWLDEIDPPYSQRYYIAIDTENYDNSGIIIQKFEQIYQQRVAEWVK